MESDGKQRTKPEKIVRFEIVKLILYYLRADSYLVTKSFVQNKSILQILKFFSLGLNSRQQKQWMATNVPKKTNGNENEWQNEK